MPDSVSTIPITRNNLGEGERALQHRLIACHVLQDEHATPPRATCICTEGVQSVLEGPPVVDSSRALEYKAVWRLLCSTHLNSCTPVDQANLGIIGGVDDILEARRLASKVVAL